MDKEIIVKYLGVEERFDHYFTDMSKDKVVKELFKFSKANFSMTQKLEENKCYNIKYGVSAKDGSYWINEMEQITGENKDE